MAIWVCRTGSKGEYETHMYSNRQIYLTRRGYDDDIKKSSKEMLTKITQEIHPDASRQTISNIWSQIDIFANRMSVGDIVLIPQKGKHKISVARIISDYKFESSADELFKHQRDIEVIKSGLDFSKFPRDIFYSLGAFRAIFSLKQEDRFIKLLNKIGINI